LQNVYDGSTGTPPGDHHQWAMLQFYDNAAIRRSPRRAVGKD
jgi:hypothetical protein